MAVRPLASRRRALLVLGAVLTVFAVVLVAYVSGPDTDEPELSAGGRQALALPAAPAGSSAPAPSPGSGAVSGAASRAARGDGSLHLPPLPRSSALNGAGPPARSVTMRIESDAAILKMGYLVKGGHPDKYLDKNVRPPAVVTTVARGYGLVAEIGAQASPYATYLTCTVTVDGQVHSRHTVHGGWAVAVCVG
jgi:hypothetical protein